MREDIAAIVKELRQLAQDSERIDATLRELSRKATIDDRQLVDLGLAAYLIAADVWRIARELEDEIRVVVIDRSTGRWKQAPPP